MRISPTGQSNIPISNRRNWVTKSTKAFDSWIAFVLTSKVTAMWKPERLAREGPSNYRRDQIKSHSNNRKESNYNEEEWTEIVRRILPVKVFNNRSKGLKRGVNRTLWITSFVSNRSQTSKETRAESTATNTCQMKISLGLASLRRLMRRHRQRCEFIIIRDIYVWARFKCWFKFY